MLKLFDSGKAIAAKEVMQGAEGDLKIKIRRQDTQEKSMMSVDVSYDGNPAGQIMIAYLMLNEAMKTTNNDFGSLINILKSIRRIHTDHCKIERREGEADV